MGDLKLKEDLILNGTLNLVGTDGGRVLVKDKPALVEDTNVEHSTTAPPVLLPPQAPVDDGQSVSIIKSFNSSVKANGKYIVTMGMFLQGKKTWPGMVMASTSNLGVKIGAILINVEGDMGTTLPTGASVTFTESGQKSQ
jgi:hypothetical protein